MVQRIAWYGCNTAGALSVKTSAMVGKEIGGPMEQRRSMTVKRLPGGMFYDHLNCGGR